MANKEQHPLFKISRFSRCLNFKRAEFEVTKKLDNINGISYLTSRTELEKILANLLQSTYTIVLNIPQLDKKTKDVFRPMQEYMDSSKSLLETGDFDGHFRDEDGLQWHMVMTTERKQVMDKVREMADHVETNKNLKDQVQVFITPSMDDKMYDTIPSTNPIIC